MKNYTFDMMLKASITVEAASQEEAERIVSGPLDDAADIQILEHGAVELSGEATLAGELTLSQIDGEDV